MSAGESPTATWFARLGSALGRPRRATLLVAPFVLFETVFFVVPLALVARVSLQARAVGAAFEPGLTLDSYAYVLSSPYVHTLAIFTLQLAVVVTAVTIALAIPYAYAIWRAPARLRRLLLSAVVVTLLTTLVVKLFAWVLLLSPRGPINDGLVAADLIDGPLALMNNEFGVVVGLVYTSLPYAILAIFSVMETIEWSVVEAARDLGASRPRSVVEVVLPEAAPGIVVGATITFAWSVGSFASPAILGSSDERTVAMEVESLVLSELNWPEAAALALTTVAAVFLALGATVAVLRRFDHGGVWNVEG